MGQQHAGENLSQIQTIWPTILESHAATPEQARQAQAEFLEHYGPAVRRYLGGALRDSQAADDVYQEFAVRFLRGSFRAADPARGRFRDLLKTALSRLVLDHRRRNRRRWLPFAEGGPEPAAGTGPETALEQEFLSAWREQLLARTWEALAEHDRRTGQSLSALLRLHAEQPALRSPQAAEQLTRQLGRPVSPEWVRKWLSRGREQFADLFVEEVARSLGGGGPEAIAEGLRELGMWEACRSALERRQEGLWPFDLSRGAGAS